MQRPGAASGAILMASVVSACGSATVSPVPFQAGFPDAGTYTTTEFKPRLTLTTNDDGWQVLFDDDEDELALEDDSGNGTLFLVSRVSQVVSPDSGLAVGAPDDLIAWLQAHPSLVAGTPKDTTVGSLPAKAIEMTNERGADVGLFAFPTGNVRMPPDTRLLFSVVPMEGPDLVITTGGHTDQFEAAIARTTPMLASLQIGDE